ncbi:MAG: FmdE family protein [Methanomicrobiales archaeon]
MTIDKLNNSKLIKPHIKSFSSVTEFHGHVCPGSAFGYKAAELALKTLSMNKSTDEELIAIVENDTCAVDAIQVVTGCTFGKGNLIFNDYGKQVYTFINRLSGEAVRISLRNSFNMDKIDPSLNQLRKKVNSKHAGPEDMENLKRAMINVSKKLIKAPAEDIFRVEHVDVEMPDKARIFESIKCSKCGEMVSAHRTSEKNGQKVCIPCSKL